MAQDDAEAITERALTRVLGYVDPVAHALATKAAARARQSSPDMNHAHAFIGDVAPTIRYER